MSDLVNYCGLPGVSGGRLDGTMANSVTGLMSAIEDHRACSAAGDHGAVQIWVDDAGALRGAFLRYGNQIDGDIFQTKAALRRWLAEWFPKMRDPS